jgi:UDP-3-O-acyl-N-acetylglucosamine deacetylase
MENELARHKILDIMGDIALAGYKIIGKIVSHKAGHKLNVELVRRLLINEPG